MPPAYRRPGAPPMPYGGTCAPGSAASKLFEYQSRTVALIAFCTKLANCTPLHEQLPLCLVGIVAGVGTTGMAGPGRSTVLILIVCGGTTKVKGVWNTHTGSLFGI
eukprot:SAG31_NODE_293_length_18292_cov_8.779586_2_plen_106_part_00